MDNIPPMQVEARLAQIRRQKANVEHLVELEKEEQRLMALQGGAGIGHLPTPGNLIQSTELPTPTPGRIIAAVDLTTPPPVQQQVKKEPKNERSDSAGPVEVERERIRQDDPPVNPEHLSNQPRINRVRQQGLAVGRVLESPPPDDVLRQQEELATNIRPAKKKKQCDEMFASVVDDVQYRNIIKSPNGDGDGLVELSCKFCGANCSVHTSVKLLFRGDNAWRGHINNCHRSSLPAGTKLNAKYMIANCLTIKALTPEEVRAVLNHKHEEFAVIMKAGPGAEPGGPNSKRKRKRSAATANVYEEGEAEREILEAIDDPDEEGDEYRNTEYAPEGRPLGLPTRKGGRRTRYTPDFMASNVE